MSCLPNLSVSTLVTDVFAQPSFAVPLKAARVGSALVQQEIIWIIVCHADTDLATILGAIFDLNF